jgi:hypothetical protein
LRQIGISGAVVLDYSTLSYFGFSSELVVSSHKSDRTDSLA